MEFEKEEAKVLAMLMSQINNDVESKRLSLMQQCNFNEGMKIFGEKGKEAALRELRQQHARKCFGPMAVAVSLDQECRRAQNALMHLAEKRDRSTKGRMVHNGKPTHEWSNKEESASPTVTTDSSFCMMTFDAKEKHNAKQQMHQMHLHKQRSTNKMGNTKQ